MHLPVPNSRRTVLIAGLLVFFGYLIATVSLYVGGFDKARAGQIPFYNDYLSQYAGALQASREAPENIYYLQRAFEYQRETARLAYPGIALSDMQTLAVGASRWMHPPTYLLISLPLAWFPFLVSAALWLSATALPYLAALRRILKDETAWTFALAAPPVYFNLGYGQSGFLIAGLIGLGLFWLPRRPVLAGVLIGLASVKPHFGILIPFALAAGGYWRAFASASATVIGLIAISVIILGDDPWFGFIGTLWHMVDGFAVDAYTWKSLTSVLSLVRGLTDDLTLAWIAQALAALAATLAVIHVWRRPATRAGATGLASAIVCFATPLAVPMVYTYDLVLLVPGAAWLWIDMRQKPPVPGEVAIAIACIVAITASEAVARHTGIQMAAVPNAGLLWLALRRAGAAHSNSAAGTA